MTSKHLFENYCVDFEDLLKSTDIKRMLRTAAKQAKAVEAKIRTDISNYKDYGDDEMSPMYFGMFGEWFAEQFLTHFGSLYNVASVNMFSHEGSSYQDNGVDGMGLSINSKQKKAHRSTCVPKAGDPVYIQVKATCNPNKEHQANDGSRIPNFVANAMSTAIKQGKAYSSRFLLFTTGRGIHYRLDEMTNGMIEVISIDEICKIANNNFAFLNSLREKVGLSSFDFTSNVLDAEAAHNLLMTESEQ